jgi:hypothetical protein
MWKKKVKNWRAVRAFSGAAALLLSPQSRVREAESGTFFASGFAYGTAGQQLISDGGGVDGAGLS